MRELNELFQDWLLLLDAIVRCEEIRRYFFVVLYFIRLLAYLDENALSTFLFYRFLFRFAAYIGGLSSVDHRLILEHLFRIRTKFLL